MTTKSMKKEAIATIANSLQGLNIAWYDALQDSKSRRNYKQYTRVMGGECAVFRDSFDHELPYEKAVKLAKQWSISVEDIYFAWLGLSERPRAKTVVDNMNDLALLAVAHRK